MADDNSAQDALEVNPYAAQVLSENDAAFHDDSELVELGPSGLGGWLILIGIGVVLSPIRLGLLLVTVFLPILSDGTAEALTTPGSVHYHWFWAPLLAIEGVGNCFFLAASCVLVFLFFRKSRYFPKAYLTMCALSLVFILIDATLVKVVLPHEPVFDSETLREVIRAGIAVVIWGPYLLISKRAKNTFVN